MNAAPLIAVIAAIVVVVLAIVWMQSRQSSRHESLRQKFGAEYDRLEAELGSRKAAQDELAQRERRVRGFDIRPADPAQWAEFSRSWQVVQAEFIEDPTKSIGDAERLVGQLMQTRGFPPGEFNQRVADISVDYPEAADGYRRAHSIILDKVDGDCRTEDLREAMVSYGALLHDLLGEQPNAAVPVAREETVTESRR